MTKYRLKIIDAFGTTDAPGESISARGMIPEIEKAQGVDEITKMMGEVADEERNRVCLVFDPNEKDASKLRMTMGDRSAVGIMKKAIQGELNGSVAIVTRPRDLKHERALCGGTFQVCDFQNMERFGLEEMILVSRQRSDRGFYRIRRGSATDEQVAAFVEELENRRDEINDQNREIARNLLLEDIRDRRSKGLPDQPASYYSGKEFSNKSLTRQWNALHELYQETAKRYGLEYELVMEDAEAEEDQIEAFAAKGGRDIETEIGRAIKESNKTKSKRQRYNEPGFEKLDDPNTDAEERLRIFIHQNPPSKVLEKALKIETHPSIRMLITGHPNLDERAYENLIMANFNVLPYEERRIAIASKHVGKFGYDRLVRELDGEDWRCFADGLVLNQTAPEVDSFLIRKAAEAGVAHKELGFVIKALSNKKLDDEDRSYLIGVLKTTGVLNMAPELKSNIEKMEADMKARMAKKS